MGAAMSLGPDSRSVNKLQPLGFLYSAYETQVLAQLDRSALPRHVAVLADGNRVGPRERPRRAFGRRLSTGADKLREFVDWCADSASGSSRSGCFHRHLTRSGPEEIGPLLQVIARLVSDLARTDSYRVQVVGDPNLLPDDIAERLLAAEQSTSGHVGIHVNVAIAYGGRHELRDAVRSLLASEAAKGTTLDELVDTLEIDHISEHLYTAGQPDPDLIIRTSGEQRMSGFLIWQSAHSEFYFCEALWPDFRKVDFIRALRSYAQRERRFGR